MSETETPTYQAGAESPVSGIRHLFTTEHITSDGSATSLCGAVRSYGPFQHPKDMDGGVMCRNCVRVRDTRQETPDE
jgi:hypothetical protein